MTRSRMFSVFAIVVLVGCASGQEPKRVRSVSVSGVATLEVVPDRAIVSVAIKNHHANTTTLTDEHAKLVDRAVTTILTQGLKREEFSSSTTAFGEHQVYRNNSYLTEGFVATTHMTCTLRDLTKSVALWKALAAVPGVSVTGVTYDLSKRTEIQEEARMKALETAKSKADRLAKAVGCTLGSPLSVRENAPPTVGAPGGWGRFSNVQTQSISMAGEGENGTAGRIPVKATIDIEYELIPVTK